MRLFATLVGGLIGVLPGLLLILFGQFLVGRRLRWTEPVSGVEG